MAPGEIRERLGNGSFYNHGVVELHRGQESISWDVCLILPGNPVPEGNEKGTFHSLFFVAKGLPIKKLSKFGDAEFNHDHYSDELLGEKPSHPGSISGKSGVTY